jgi:hypothetical protein
VRGDLLGLGCLGEMIGERRRVEVGVENWNWYLDGSGKRGDKGGIC